MARTKVEALRTALEDVAGLSTHASMKLDVLLAAVREEERARISEGGSADRDKRLVRAGFTIAVLGDEAIGDAIRWVDTDLARIARGTCTAQRVSAIGRGRTLLLYESAAGETPSIAASAAFALAARDPSGRGAFVHNGTIVFVAKGDTIESACGAWTAQRAHK